MGFDPCVKKLEWLVYNSRDTPELFHDTCGVPTSPPPGEQTDVCENITFPQLRLQAEKIDDFSKV